MGNITTLLPPRIELITLYNLRQLCNDEEKKVINTLKPNHTTFNICPHTGKLENSIDYFKNNHKCCLAEFLNSGVDLNGKFIIVSDDQLEHINVIYKKYNHS